MAYKDIEESRLYQRAEKVADEVWAEVVGWVPFAKDTIGQQLSRATDSIGANIAESAGRFHPGDVVRFLYFTRGSLKESRFWLKRAKQRQLISDEFFNHVMTELNLLAKELNAYINYQRTRSIKESSVDYEIHPLIGDDEI
ncbi:MAG: four helix bundle protein [Anaerolineae bacterium]|nr:four helix bundle protein [Anaerolineae bacterium]